MITFVRIILLTFFVFSFSCSRNLDDNYNQNTTLKDSIQFYFDLAENKQNTLVSRHENINASYRLIKKFKPDTSLSKVLYLKSIIHLSLNEYDSLLLFNRILNQHAESIEDDLYLAKQHYLKGYYYDIIEIPDSAFFHYNLSKTYFLKINDSSEVGGNLLNMSLIQKNQNDFFGSKETITEALQYLQPEIDEKYVASSYNTLGTNHRKLLNFKEALAYFKKAIHKTKSKKNKLAYKNNLAATYIDNAEFDNAIKILKKIVSDSILKKRTSQYARVLDNLAYAQWRSKKNTNPKAFLEPLKMRQGTNDKRGQIASYTHLGEFYSKTNPIKATSYFDSVIQLAKTIKMPRAEKDAVQFLMQLQPQNVSLRDRYIFLQDSLYAQEHMVKTQFAKYKYDDKQKQENILRLEKESAEKELEVTQQRTQKIISFAVGALLLMSLGFAIYYFVQRAKRLKQKSEREKQKEVYDTEAKLSRRVHDDFGGKLNQAIILLQNDAPKAKVLNVVGNAYDQSRDFSREINDVDTGPNFKNVLFAMLGSFSENITLATTGSTTLKWETISEFTKKTIYKVLQELMTNMQKHSKASLVSIDFEQSKKKLKIEYSDDGIGTSKDKLNTKNGLLNTEKRIQAINGSITFDSDNNKGFNALIEVPN